MDAFTGEMTPSQISELTPLQASRGDAVAGEMMPSQISELTPLQANRSGSTHFCAVLTAFDGLTDELLKADFGGLANELPEAGFGGLTDELPKVAPPTAAGAAVVAGAACLEAGTLEECVGAGTTVGGAEAPRVRCGKCCRRGCAQPGCT